MLRIGQEGMVALCWIGEHAGQLARSVDRREEGTARPSDIHLLNDAGPLIRQKPVLDQSDGERSDDPATDIFVMGDDQIVRHTRYVWLWYHRCGRSGDGGDLSGGVSPPTAPQSSGGEEIGGRAIVGEVSDVRRIAGIGGEFRQAIDHGGILVMVPPDAGVFRWSSVWRQVAFPQADVLLKAGGAYASS